MSNAILVGRGRQLIELSRQAWEQDLAKVPEHMAARLAFMTEAHHRVRSWVVRELPRQNAPITVAAIARALGLSEAHVTNLLDDLEQHLFFLVRDTQGSVNWAFPVTLTPTPHALRFSTGEQCFAA
ncbi:MAG: hypothetical protein LAO21_06255 [Acidobacteriia bacterium]|nr:hypothetical protein [Terriglobia bacterium]